MVQMLENIPHHHFSLSRNIHQLSFVPIIFINLKYPVLFSFIQVFSIFLDVFSSLFQLQLFHFHGLYNMNRLMLEDLNAKNTKTDAQQRKWSLEIAHDG